MSKTTSTKSGKEKSAGGVERRPRDLVARPPISGVQGQVLNLQRTIGNRAISKLLQSNVAGQQQSNQSRTRETSATPSGTEQPKPDSRASLLLRANADSGGPLDKNVREPLENKLGVNLGGVRVHSGPSSETAAESLGARAYTIGSDIYLGPAARNLNTSERKKLLAHEAVHTTQQGGRPVLLQGSMPVSSPGDSAEIEADHVAETVLSDPGRNPSAALTLRDNLRVSPVAPSVQRDIVGDKTWANGSKLEIKFTKTEATVAGAVATETGGIKFTPGATAPESDSIRLVQIARTFDTTTNKEFNWTGTAEAARQSIMTKEDSARHITGGFYIDQIHASQAKRTNKKSPDVLPYYDVTSPGTKGKRKGATIIPATLQDAPNFSAPLKFCFVTSAKGQDNGVWYGSVLWGFETYLVAGVAKIKGEYKSFSDVQGETTDEALRKFNEYYRNKGTSTAP